MASGPSHSVKRSASASSRRVRRRSTPLGFWFWAWLATVLLFLGLVLVMVPVNWIQATTEHTARKALSRSGAAGWADVDVSGQWVTLRGTPPSRDEGKQAIAAVAAAQADTWLGRFVPAVDVRGEFTAAPTESPPTTTPAAAAGLEWSFRVENGALRLEGEVPDASSRNALEATAREAITREGTRIERLDNQLVVVEQEVPDGFLAVAERGLTNVAACDMGVAEFSCDRYNLLCELPESRAAAVRQAARAPLPLGRVGSVQVLANEAVASCEQALADVLTRSTIRFASESDAIDAASGPVLDEVAQAATDCPGTLRIEGHTDNTGDPTFNQDLSQRRALSVRSALVERGLSRRRLVARGYGARVPVADNATEAGRSRNRRIEIRVVRASD